MEVYENDKLVIPKKYKKMSISEIEKEIELSSDDYVKLSELISKKETLEEELSVKMDRWVYLNELYEKIENGNI